MVVPLTLAVAQPLTIVRDVVGNVERRAEAIRGARANVVVFPELSVTGYEFGADPLDPSDDRLSLISHACAETGTLALAVAPVEAPGGVSIGMMSVDADGVIALVYRKTWLGQAEAGRFVPGTTPGDIAAVKLDRGRTGSALFASECQLVEQV